jgi:uncharacterized protein
MEVLIFSHESDMDGLFSAAIGLIRYPQARTVFLGYGKESFETMGHFANSFSASSPTSEKRIIIICDLGLNEDQSLIDLCIGFFSKAKNDGCDIFWLDHHPWPDRAVEAVKPFVEITLDKPGNKCAAELMYDKLLVGNELAAKLASMAHTMDFFTNDQYLTPISELIVYYRNSSIPFEKLSFLALKVSKGILWDMEMQNDYAMYSQIQEKAKREAYKTIQFKEIDGRFKTAFIQSSRYIQNSLFAQEVFEKTKTDIVVLYGTDGKVSIRRNNTQVSCRRIAENLPEGGGHDFAAGAKYNSDPSKPQAIIWELEAAILKSL